MTVHSKSTVKVHLPKVSELLANYLNHAEKNSLTILEVLNEKNIKDYFKKLTINNEDKLNVVEFIKQNSNTVARAYLDGFLLEHRNYFEITPEMDWDGGTDQFIPDHIAYIGREPKAYDSFEVLQKLYHIQYQEHITMAKVLQNTFDKVSEREEIYQEFMELYPDYKEELTDFDAVTNELSAELFELVIPDNIQRMFEHNEFRITTVGQNNWTYYVTHESYNNHNEALDIWEGWNFYTIKLLETNEDRLFIGYAEEIHFVYAPDLYDLFVIIESYFGLKKDEIALVDNEVAQGISGVNKLTVREELFIEEKVEKE